MNSTELIVWLKGRKQHISIYLFIDAGISVFDQKFSLLVSSCQINESLAFARVAGHLKKNKDVRNELKRQDNSFVGFRTAYFSTFTV